MLPQVPVTLVLRYRGGGGGGGGGELCAVVACWLGTSGVDKQASCNQDPPSVFIPIAKSYLSFYQIGDLRRERGFGVL